MPKCTEMQLAFYSPTQESEERRCAGFARLVERHGGPSEFRGCASTETMPRRLCAALTS